jgi:hypothetical protein
MAKVELYDKGGNLISSFTVGEEFCKKARSMTDQQLLFEVANMIALAVRRETELELTVNMVLNELGKVVVCNKEIELDGGAPAD